MHTWIVLVEFLHYLVIKVIIFCVRQIFFSKVGIFATVTVEFFKRSTEAQQTKIDCHFRNNLLFEVK